MGKLLTFMAGVAIIATYVAFATRPAPAAELNITFGPRYLREPVAPPPGPRIIHVPQDESPEAIARRDEWKRVCEPRIWVGADGIGRYVYGDRCPNGYVTNVWREVE